MTGREFTTEQLLAIIGEALKARDFKGVSAALHLLALRDPHAADAFLSVINLAKGTAA